MKYWIAFSAPDLTSSLCPQNNSVVIGFQRAGALKPRGAALRSQMRGERRSVPSNVTFILELWPLGPPSCELTRQCWSYNPCDLVTGGRHVRRKHRRG